MSTKKCLIYYYPLIYIVFFPRFHTNKRMVGKMKALTRTAGALREMIAEMEKSGIKRLPAERDLARDLSVSRHSLRGALAQLEAEGLLWRTVGKGTFIGAKPVGGPGDLMLIGSLTNPSEVMEARQQLEPSLAALAARRANSQDLDRMRLCLRKSEAAPDPSTYEHWDGELHRTVARATHNTLLLALFDAVNAVRTHVAWGDLRAASLTRERQKVYCAQHRKYVESIARRDPVAAETDMREHLETVASTLLRSSA